MPKTLRSLLCSQNVWFLVNFERLRTNLKKVLEKTPVLKFGYGLMGLRKPYFETKNIHFKKSHKAENVNPLRFLNIHSVAKYQKIEGEPFGDFEKFSKKVSQSRNGGLIVPKKKWKRNPSASECL